MRSVLCYGRLLLVLRRALAELIDGASEEELEEESLKEAQRAALLAKEEDKETNEDV